MRSVRRLPLVVLLLVLLAGVVVLVDLLLTSVAEERVAEGLEERLGAPAEVELSGWPVALRVLAGLGVPRVDVHAIDVPARGGELDRLDVTMTGVEVDVGDLRAGLEDLPPAQRARFEAEVGEAALQRMLRLPAELAGFSLTPGGAELDVAGVAVIEAAITAEDGVVVLTPRSPIAPLLGFGRVPVDLSDQPGRPYVEDVRVEDGGLVLTGTLRGVETSAR